MKTTIRSQLGLGLAFIIGMAVFVIVFQAARIWGGGQYEPLDPVAKRVTAPLEMPVLSLADGDPSKVWKLKDQEGKVVVVNYFATWCGPCMEELPDLRKLAKEYEPKGVVFVTVAIDIDNESKPGVSRDVILKDFAKSSQFPFPILLPARDSALMQDRPPIPQTFLFDRHGRRARGILGGVGGQSVDRSLDELLKES